MRSQRKGRGAKLIRNVAIAIMAAAMLLLLSYSAIDIAYLSGPVPVAAVTLSGDGGKWVVINRKGERQGTGAYVYAAQFSEGLAAVSDGLGWGYVDTSGKLVIPCKFSRAGEFHDGLAPVKTGGRSLFGGEARWNGRRQTSSIDEEVKGGWGYINKSGEYQFSQENLDYAWEFYEGKGIVLKDGRGYSISIDGTLSEDTYRPRIRHLSEEEEEREKEEEKERMTIPTPEESESKLSGYMLDDKWVIEPTFERADYFSEGLAAIQENGKCGYIDLTGTIRIETDFEGAGRFKEGLAAVKVNGKWGYIDKTGSIVIEPRFDGADWFENGLARVTIAGKVGIINKQGEIVIPCIYSVVFFSSGEGYDAGIGTTRIGDKFGFVRADGSVICEPQFDEQGSFRGGYAAVKKEGGWNLIDRNARPQYDLPLDKIEVEDDSAIVSRGGKKGYFNKLTGKKTEVIYDEIHGWDKDLLIGTRDGCKWLISETDYRETGLAFEDIGWGYGDRIRFKKNGLWGFLDASLKVKIPPMYIEEDSFYGDNAPVRTLRGWGFIDREGRVVVEPQYAELAPAPYDEDCGFAKLAVGPRMQLADSFGRLIGVVFEQICSFHEGLAAAMSAGKWGYIDARARTCIPMRFAAAGDFSEGLAPVCNGSKWGYIGLDGTTAIPFDFDSAESFGEGLGLITRGGKWYFIDKTGTVSLGPYDYPVLGFEGAFAWVSDGKQDWAPINHTGRKDESRVRKDKTISEMVALREAGNLRYENPAFAPVVETDSILPSAEGLRGFGREEWLARGGIEGVGDIEGRVISPPMFDSIRNFSCGLALAERNGRTCFVRTNGTIAFFSPRESEYTCVFNEGYARVRGERGCNFLDRQGNLICDEWYSGSWDFSEGLASASRGKEGFIDGTGEFVIPPKYESARSFCSGLALVETIDGWTAIDHNGTQQFPPMNCEIDDFTGEYAVVRENEVARFITRKGEFVNTRFTDIEDPAGRDIGIDPAVGIKSYYRVATFVSGLAAVAFKYSRDGYVLDLKSGKARKVRDFQTTYIPAKSGPVIAWAATEEGGWGALDENLAWVIPPDFAFIEEFSEGLAFAALDGVTGYIDVSGKWAFTLPIDRGEPFRHGVAWVETENGNFWINRKGQKARLADADSDDARFCSYEGGTAGFFDLKGEIAISPWFNEVRSFAGGLASVQNDNHLWGFIDKSGAYIIQPKFTETGDFSEGLAAVLVGDKQNGLWTFVDRKGNQIHEPYFDEVRAFHQGLAAVRRGALWGYMDKHGWMVFPLQFNSAGDFMMEEAR
ncbi:MAG: WG repeat-containing protein [Candidatus Brocadiia bacterium]